jgi:hypothetical protein
MRFFYLINLIIFKQTYPMKIYSKIKIASYVFAGAFMASACTKDFESMNVSPNKPSAVSSAVLLPNGIESSVDRYWGHRARFERINLDGGMLWITTT